MIELEAVRFTHPITIAGRQARDLKKRLNSNLFDTRVPPSQPGHCSRITVEGDWVFIHSTLAGRVVRGRAERIVWALDGPAAPKVKRGRKGADDGSQEA